MKHSEHVEQTKTLSYSAFRDPDRDLTTKPLWFWNTDLDHMTEEGVREIVRKSYAESGYSGFGILPYWQDGYLSDRYFALYEAALDEGAKLGMHFSLYDEDGFPSYTAGGLFAKAYPELTAKRLDMVESSDVQNGRIALSIPQGTFMGAVLFCPATGERVNVSDQAVLVSRSEEKSGGSTLNVAVAGEGWKAMAFVCVSEGSIGMDYLSEEAVRGFIDLTYEAYYKRFKTYFDNGTITTAFYDEPSFWPAVGKTAYGVQGARMWTEDFNEVFASMFGEEIDPVLYYPALWYDIGKDTAEARVRLNEVRREMFADHYVGQVSRWCEAHGIALMGHMLFEDKDNPVPLHGDLMYAFKYQTIPAVDVIDHYDMTGPYYKIISSSAYNWDKPLVASETYGAMGTDLPVSHLYKCAMDLYAKGINLIVPHAVWYDGQNNVVFPPELSWRNPRYAEELPRLNRYFARLSTLLQEGRHVADIAVLYPIDTLAYDYTFHGGFDTAPESNYIALTDRLSTVIRKDFTFLHPTVLDEKVSVRGKCLHLDNENNFEEYRVMILPSVKVISLSNLQKILAFYRAGGQVVSVGLLPTQASESKDTPAVLALLTDLFGESPAALSDRRVLASNDVGGRFLHLASVEELDAALDELVESYDVSLSPFGEQGGHFTYIHKVVEGTNVWFFANSNDVAITPTVTLRGKYFALEVWDPMTGERCPLKAEVKDGVTVFPLPLAAVTSLFVIERP